MILSPQHKLRSVLFIASVKLSNSKWQKFKGGVISSWNWNSPNSIKRSYLFSHPSTTLPLHWFYSQASLGSKRVTAAIASVALWVQVQRKWELLIVQTDANENLALTFSKQNCICFCSWKIISAKAMECLEQGLVHMPIPRAFLKIEKFYLLFSAVLDLSCCTAFL